MTVILWSIIGMTILLALVILAWPALIAAVSEALNNLSHLR